MFMDKHERFELEADLAIASMRAAKRKAALTLHDMEANPTGENIAAYERALDEWKGARKRLRDVNEAEMKQRDISAFRVKA